MDLGVQVAQGQSRRRIIAQNPAIPERLVREMKKAGLGEGEYRDMMTNALQEAAAEALESWRKDLADGKVPPSSKPIAAAVYLDKAAMLTGKTAMESINVSLMVNSYGTSPAGKSREEIIRSLTGEPDLHPTPCAVPQTGLAILA